MGLMGRGDGRWMGIGREDGRWMCIGRGDGRCMCIGSRGDGGRTRVCAGQGNRVSCGRWFVARV